MGGGLIINICEYLVLLTYMYFWMSGGGFTIEGDFGHPYGQRGWLDVQGGGGNF
jgi:hypothetical protein